MSRIKRFYVSLLKSLIVIIVISIIFSHNSSDVNKILSESFGDVYQFSSEDSKAKAISVLETDCKGLSYDSSTLTAGEICSNKTLLQSLKSNCIEYRRLKSQGYEIKDEELVKESCEKIETLESECKLISERVKIDKDKVREVCNEHSSGKIDNKEFFTRIITQSISPDKVDNKFFQKYNKLANIMQNNISVFLVLILIMLILILLLTDLEILLLSISKISFNTALAILLPYAVILAYKNFVGIDTSEILEGIFSGKQSFEFSNMASLVMLMILKSYNGFIIILGIILLVIGIAGRAFKGFILRNIGQH